MSYLGYEDFEVGHDEFGSSTIRPLFSKAQSDRLAAELKLKEPQLRKSVDILLGPLFEGRHLTLADREGLRTAWVSSGLSLQEKKAQAKVEVDRLAKKNAWLAKQAGGVLPPGASYAAPQGKTRKAGYAGAAIGALGVGWAGSAVAAEFDAPTWTGVLFGVLAGGTVGYFTGAGVAERFHDKKVAGAHSKAHQQATATFGADASQDYRNAKRKVKEWKKKLKRYNDNKFKSGPLEGKVKDPLGRDIAKSKVKEWERNLERAKEAGGGPPPDASDPVGTKMAPMKMAPDLPLHAYTFDLKEPAAPIQTAEQVTGWFAAPMVGESGPSRGVVIGSFAGLATVAGLGGWWFSR